MRDEELLLKLHDMGAHSDVCETLLDSAKRLGEYQEISKRQYGAIALVTQGIPFAFAQGRTSVHYRIHDDLMPVAYESGAVASFAGSQWIQFTLFRNDHPKYDLEFWCRKAYFHARKQSVT